MEGWNLVHVVLECMFCVSIAYIYIIHINLHHGPNRKNHVVKDHNRSQNNGQEQLQNVLTI
jgi:hypothetical protein